MSLISRIELFQDIVGGFLKYGYPKPLVFLVIANFGWFCGALILSPIGATHQKMSFKQKFASLDVGRKHFTLLKRAGSNRRVLKSDVYSRVFTWTACIAWFFLLLQNVRAKCVTITFAQRQRIRRITHGVSGPLFVPPRYDCYSIYPWAWMILGHCSAVLSAVLFSLLMCFQAPVANKLTSFLNKSELWEIEPPVERVFQKSRWPYHISKVLKTKIRPPASQQPLVDCCNAAIQAAGKKSWGQTDFYRVSGSWGNQTS